MNIHVKPGRILCAQLPPSHLAYGAAAVVHAGKHLLLGVSFAGSQGIVVPVVVLVRGVAALHAGPFLHASLHFAFCLS